MPNLSLTTTREPCASCSMYLIGTLVRPSSTDSCTGMSSTRLMSLMTCSPPLTALAPLAAPARGGRTGSPLKGPPCCPSAGGSSLCFCSLRALAQPLNGSSAEFSAGWPWPGAGGAYSVDIFFAQPAWVCIAQAFLDADGVSAIVGSVLAFKNRHPADRRPNARLALEFDEVAGLERQQLLDRGIGTGQFRHQDHFCGLNLARQHAHPAAVDLDRVALRRRVQPVADRLQRRIRHAHTAGPRPVPHLPLERRGDHDFPFAGHIRELWLHLRALVFELERINALPGFFVFGADHVDQPVDDPLLGRRKIPPLDPGLELAGAAEQGVDDAEHQRRLANDQAAAAQRTDGHDVEVGRHHQLAQKGAVALHRHHADGDFRAAPDEVEKPDAQVAREPLIDDFHRRHPATDDALLAGEVVVAHAAGLDHLLYPLLALALDPFEQRIDLFLRQK